MAGRCRAADRLQRRKNKGRQAKKKKNPIPEERKFQKAAHDGTNNRFITGTASVRCRGKRIRKKEES